MTENTICFSNKNRRFSELMANLQALHEHQVVVVTDSKFITPLAVLPVCALAKKLGRQVTVDSDRNSAGVCSYLKTIGFPDGCSKVHFEGGTYLPITRVDFPTPEEALNSAASEYVSLILSESGERNSSTLETSLKYAFGEMTTNVHEHARSTHYWMFAQKWPKLNLLEFCLIDDGIGIRTRFLEAGIAVNNDLEALVEATQGRSAKKADSGLLGDRGHGIRSTMRLLTGKEFQGTFVMISGNAGFLKDHSGEQVFEAKLPWPGVIICARVIIPETNFDFYRYI